jgi:hypothetical protein
MDWNIKSSLSENLEFNDNRRMLANPAGNSYNSVSSLLFNATALTPTSSAAFIGNLKYLTFAGPGEADSRNTLDKYVTTRFEKKEKRTSYNFSASYHESDASTVQLEETGFATLRGSVIVTTVGGGLKHELGPRDTIAWSTNYSSVNFTENNGTPSDSLTSTLDWTHRVSPITVLTPSLQYQRTNYSNASQTDVTFWRAMMGMNTELTKRLSFQAAGGGILLDGERNIVGGNATSGAQESGSHLGWVANVQLIYKLLQNVRVSVAAARSVAPTTFGEFTRTDSLNLALNYDINQVSSRHLRIDRTTMATEGSLVSVPGACRYPEFFGVFSAAIAYSRQLAREWRTNCPTDISAQ